jgi:chromosome segregation ATPase
MERELNDGKIQLNNALDAKEREIAEANELITSLKNQESILERELNDGKIKLDEAFEGKARVAAEYSYAVNKYIDLKDSMTSLVANQTNQFINDQNISTNAKVEEEKARGKLNLQRLSDEYEVLLSKKSRKIFELRQALRSANDRKRRLERQLRLGAKENESELRMGKEERKRLMTEIT